MMYWPKNISLACILSVTMLTGCTGKSEPTSFFMLRSIDEISDTIAGEVIVGSDISVMVGPVTISNYLDRSQIIGRQEGVEVLVHDFDHWAEPLDKNVARVLMANLSTLLGTAKVYDFENSISAHPKFQVQVEIGRFDFSENGTAVFVAYWTIYDANGTPLSRNKTVMTEDVTGRGMASRVAAQNRVVTDFSRVVARKLAELNIVTPAQILG
ncbi:PqiC family protein [Desulfosediminicola sp.]|uniref:PqiC family protein n=1 Tax=Desulfosediminicola sp. TaxID=2886825 RepID=UPI003AF239A7